MYNFNCDYLEGVHPNIIKALEETNMVQQQGYCNDEYTHQAKELIRKRFLIKTFISYMVLQLVINLLSKHR